MPGTPEEQWFALAQNPDQLNPTEVQNVYDQLKPVAFEQLQGKWVVHLLNTGHPAHREIEETIMPLRKDFISPTFAQKVSLTTGERFPEWGDAFMVEARFRGVVSSAMVYDDHPMIDHFRYLNDDTVAAVNWHRKYDDVGFFFLYLTRCQSPL